MGQANESWKKLLNPEVLRGNLLGISLFITAYEVFKAAVVDKPRVFFTCGFDESGPILGDGYKAQVLAKSSNTLRASLLWFQELGAIDEADVAIVDDVRLHRNEVVHKPFEFLSDPKHELDGGKIELLINLLQKIETWWFAEFELAVNPGALPEGADPATVIPGSVFTLALLLDIALCNEPGKTASSTEHSCKLARKGARWTSGKPTSWYCSSRSLSLAS